MVQNRNKLIDLMIGNISNTILHKILEKAIQDENIRSRYDNELNNSLNISIEYRNKINPIDSKLPEKDIIYIKDKIIKKVKSELLLRINKGYKGIDINLIESITEEFLEKLKIK